MAKPANTVDAFVPVKKIISRRPTRDGKLLLTFDDGYMATLSKDDIELMQLVGTKVPGVGQEVLCVVATNQSTGVVNDTWCALSF